LSQDIEIATISISLRASDAEIPKRPRFQAFGKWSVV
jgi:hypothetical protein